MRIVIFTGNPHLTSTPWWPVVLATPKLEGVLICRHAPPRGLRALLKNLRRNVRKHGLIFVPYRILVLVRDLATAPFRHPHIAPPLRTSSLTIATLEAPDLHAPGILDQIRRWSPDLGLSLGAPILKPALFALPRMGTINLHLGKVPEFRGAPPGFWELYTDATEVGATVHWMDEGLDTGPVIAQACAPITDADSMADVEERVTELGVGALRRALAVVDQGRDAAAPQGPGGRTFRFPTVRQRAALALRLLGRRLAVRPDHLRIWGKRVAALGVLGLYRPLRDLTRTLRGTHPIRIFTYHRVSALSRDGMTIRPRVFGRQAEYIARTHRVASLEAALDLVRSGARLRRPVAVITFDDGYRSVHDVAAPELARRGLVGTCFVCTSLVDTDERLPHDDTDRLRRHFDLMGWRELASLRRAGWSIGAHTATHARLAACNADALDGELADPLAALRSRMGMGDVALAYPFGGPDDVPPGFARIAQEAGYAACLSNFGGENPTGTDPWSLHRIDLGGDHDELAWRAAARGVPLSAIRTALFGETSDAA